MHAPATASSARSKGLRLVLLGSAMFSLFVFMPTSDNTGMIDFMAHYFPARTLLHHGDPYNPDQVLREYLAQRGQKHEGSLMQGVATHYPYPPTLFFLTVPFAVLPFSLAKLLWGTLSVSSMIVASLLIWNLGTEYEPRVSGALIAFLLVNGETLAESGTVSALAIGFGSIGAWCFLKQRWEILGTVCLAASLISKPQEFVLIWLCLLLSGRSHRKRACKTLVVAILLSLPSVVWVTHIVPNWPREIAGMISGGTSTGSILDPGPTSVSTPGSMLNFQVAASLIYNDPHFYNPVTYLICGGLIVFWGFVTQRPGAPKEIWIALAAIAGLSLLIVYHRRYDSKLLLLALPACTKLWAEGGKIGRVALAVTGSALLFTGDGLWIFVSRLLQRLPPNHSGLLHFLQTVFVVLPAPLSLVALSGFYLWLYASRTAQRAAKVSDSPSVARA